MTVSPRLAMPATLAALLLLSWVAAALAQPPENAQVAMAPQATGPSTGGAAVAEAPQTDRASIPAPMRHVLVKALGQGFTPQEAEEKAVANARALAAKHLAAIGGTQALLPAPEGQRVVNLRHFPVLGFSPARAVVLVELKLRGQTEPLPAQSTLPVLRLSSGAGVLSLESNRSCEAVIVLAPETGGQPEYLPGGVQTLRLIPGKPLRQAVPQAAGQTVHVLACTGGLSVQANPASVDEAFAKARAGRPRPTMLQGVVSDCVEQRLPRSGKQPQ